MFSIVEALNNMMPIKTATSRSRGAPSVNLIEEVNLRRVEATAVVFLDVGVR
jgi:membrane peptidoglycan carboxypeptidase